MQWHLLYIALGDRQTKSFSGAETSGYGPFVHCQQHRQAVIDVG
jgi:hypothetical protein